MTALASKAIGFLVLAAIDTKARDVESVLSDFRRCLNTYEDWAESFWSFGALDVEQVFKVGDGVSLVAPSASTSPSNIVAMCPASGSLTLVHMFQSARFVPIGNTPVMLQALSRDGAPIGAAIHKTIGPDGILEVSDCTRGIAQALLVFSDEPLLFIYLCAAVSWIRMLPPPYMIKSLGEISGEVLINLLLVWVAGGVGVAVRLSTQVLGKAMEVPNPLPMVRGSKAPRTTLAKQEAQDDAPAQSKNLNGDATTRADSTLTHGCPVSMVTGEELLAITDGELDGILPFAWTRLYRTSAVEVDCGLGFGWSHGLAQRLVIDGDSVVWTDHENRNTTFPLPSQERPAISNSLAEAAIYRGELPDELVVVEASRFYHFRDGVLTSISDGYDNRLRIFRNVLGRIQRLDNGAGRALLLRYDRGHIVAVDYQVFHLDAAWVTAQNLVAYRYDEDWRLIEATNAVGESEHYRYDAQHVIQERALAGGASFFWAWERSGKAARCVRHWASFAQMDTRYAWEEDGRVTLHNADGSQEVYVHDQRARLVQRVDPNGATHFKSYDANGRLTVEQDPLGAIKAYQYDEAGRLIALFPGDDEPTFYKHHNGFVRLMRRGQAVWKYQRNDQGDITRKTDPDGNATDYSYDKRGQLTAIWHPDHSCQRLTWNDLGQRVEEQLANGGVRRYRYDDLGRQIAREDEHGALTQYHWDAVGRLLKIVLPGGATREFSYNAYGKITAERDELSRVTRYEYADGLHLISRRINPDGSALRYRYDNVRLLLTEIENEAGERYQLEYHANGLIQQETGFDGQRTAYTYDLNGHLLEKTEYGDDDSQLVTRYERDAAGRLVRKTLPDGDLIEYTYDRLGNLLGVDDGDWPLHYEYDLQNRLSAEHQGWGTLRYGYDTCGQLTSVRLPDNNRLDFHHDKGGHLASVDLNGATLTSHLFSAGREHQRQQGQLLSHYHYDDQGRLHAHALTRHRYGHYRRQYDYDRSDNLIRLLDARKGQHDYHYDPLDRLTRADHSQDLQERFAHDPAGNLLMQDRPEPGVIVGNRLLVQGDRHYDHDAFGNVIRERRGRGQQLITEYRYDCQHRLIGLTRPDGTQASYRYDPFGRRVSKTVEGKTTELFWRGDTLIAEHSDEHHCSYVYEPNSFRPLVLLEGFGPKTVKPFHYQLDHLGTPQELNDPKGEIVWSAHYRAYGKIARLDVDIVDNPLRFQGQYFDRESGLHYNRHRYYNPDNGRYLTPDPMKLAGGVNGYRYAPNPTGWVDPLGLSSCPGGDGCKNQARPEIPTEWKTVDEGTGIFISR